MCRSQAGSIDSAVIALLEKGRERREATRGEAPKRWMCIICAMRICGSILNTI